MRVGGAVAGVAGERVSGRPLLFGLLVACAHGGPPRSLSHASREQLERCGPAVTAIAAGDVALGRSRGAFGDCGWIVAAVFPKCAEAWADSPAPEASVAVACAAAYCAELGAPKPALCTRPPEDAARDLAELLLAIRRPPNANVRHLWVNRGDAPFPPTPEMVGDPSAVTLGLVGTAGGLRLVTAQGEAMLPPDADPREALGRLLGPAEGRVLLLAADGTVPEADVVRVLDAAREIGFDRVATLVAPAP